MAPRNTPPLTGAPPPSEPDELELPEPQPAAAAATRSRTVIDVRVRRIVTSRCPAARIEPQVGQVREHVEDDDEEGAVQRQRHQRWQVEVGDRLLRVLADALQAED